MNYTLHQLQIFLKVAEKQSVTKAAEELHLTQPAVSIQLKNLQDQFEIPLLETQGRQVFITEFGKDIALASKRIIDEIGEINSKALAYKGLLVGTLKISVVSTGKYVMPFFLSDFLKLHPGIDLQMDVTNKAEVVASLADNEVDLAMVSVLPENQAVNREELMENRLYLIGSAHDNRLGDRVNVKTLEKVPLIYREKGSATRLAMERYIKENRLSVKKTMQLTSNEAVKQAVLAGLGYSIMPLIGLKNQLNNQNLRIIEVKGLPIITNWNLIWRKGKALNPVTKAYLEFIAENKAMIIAKNFEWYVSSAS